MAKEKLTYERKLVWDVFSVAEKNAAFDFAFGYRRFISEVKTEKEAVVWIKKEAEKKGFSELGESRKSKKVYLANHSSALALAILGKRPIRDGVRIIISHIDAPRLDLKPQPLVEEESLSFLKTHYYGGIKKYQWVTKPLSLHGTVVLKSGVKKEIVIGEKENEPVLTVTDLLPHLAKDQMAKKMSDAVDGESLNLLIASLPVPKEKNEKTPQAKNRVKEAVLKLLYQAYGIKEEDLISAELAAVPAGPARELGLDRSLILGYGQDDRVCAYASFQAFLEAGEPEYTSICLLADKEEIGSEGISSAQSGFLNLFLCQLAGITETELARSFAKSYAVSADVNAGLDPSYREVNEAQNAPRLGYGTVLTKYTGHGGKFGSSEAGAEYVAYLRRLFEKHKVIWQTGELGKIDKGGGGTVAKYLARQNIETIDIGPALLSMHSPYEVSHKGDLYCTYKAFLAFYKG
ncbi:MAG: aminopeptidase [Candidatus Ratteibacteria bacterium]|jgi:aspartyl aminopeptidase